MSSFKAFQFNFAEYFTQENILLIVAGIIIVIVTIIIDQLIRRTLTRYSERLRLDKHVENTLKLFSRIVVAAAGMVALLQLFGMPTEWFIGVSALTGAAVGFASTQTVGNFLAGLYLMISRPFMVRDYVKIGDIEGEVREITINYTKIYTPNYNLVQISNRKVLDSIILNHSRGDIIDYTFSINFSHDLTNEELVKNCIIPAIDEIYEKYKQLFPKKPEFTITKITRLEREFSIRIFFPEGKINMFYKIRPELLHDIMKRWDDCRTQKAK